MIMIAFQAICRDIELPQELTYYFGLYVIETVGCHVWVVEHWYLTQHVYHQEGSLSGRIVRKLQDFECPYLALQQAKRRSILQVHWILSFILTATILNYVQKFRRAYWSKEIDAEVLRMDVNDVALNVLYIQVNRPCEHELYFKHCNFNQLLIMKVANDIKAGHFSITDEEQRKLQTLRKAGDRKGYLEVHSLQWGIYVELTSDDCIRRHAPPKTTAKSRWSRRCRITPSPALNAPSV